MTLAFFKYNNAELKINSVIQEKVRLLESLKLLRQLELIRKELKIKIWGSELLFLIAKKKSLLKILNCFRLQIK